MDRSVVGILRLAVAGLCLVAVVGCGSSSVADPLQAEPPISLGGSDGATPSRSEYSPPPNEDLDVPDEIDCESDSPVDSVLCQTIEGIEGSGDGPGCELADGGQVWTEPFAAANPDRPQRCAVPSDKESAFLGAVAQYGGKIDGLATLGDEGTPDYRVFYLIFWEDSLSTPAYWPDTQLWSEGKGIIELEPDEYHATAEDVIDAICSKKEDC